MLKITPDMHLFYSIEPKSHSRISGRLQIRNKKKHDLIVQTFSESQTSELLFWDLVDNEVIADDIAKYLFVIESIASFSRIESVIYKNFKKKNSFYAGDSPDLFVRVCV